MGAEDERRAVEEEAVLARKEAFALATVAARGRRNATTGQLSILDRQHLAQEMRRGGEEAPRPS